MNVKTADLCDEFPNDLQLVDSIFRSFGDKPMFAGEIVTVKVYEDNGLVRKALKKLGKGRVLVVDGGASVRSAIVSEKEVALAIRNGWEGILVYGSICDSAEINALDIGVKALNTCPIKCAQRGEGQNNIAVKFASVSFIPGHYLYADEDGVLVAEKKLF